jgi:hypothetical protein
LEEISKPIEQDPKIDNLLHPSFPGLNSGKPFLVDVVTQTSWHRSVNPQMVRLAADCDDPIAKNRMIRELYGEPIRAMSNLEFPPNVVICSIPTRLERSILNAASAQFLPIEIVCDEKAPETEQPRDDKATQAWNLSVRLLYKASLVPWRLADAAGDSCFAGVSFYRETRNASPHAWTSFARLVTDFGQGFILKGDTFEWSPKNKTEEAPHLDEKQVAKLMSRILEAHRKIDGRLPRKVVVHKTSPYHEGERAGFADSLRGIEQYALVTASSRGVFFLRPGRKPIFRGAAIPFGEKLGAVYLSGYIKFMKNNPGNRVPRPFEITENWGPLTFQEAATDFLRLTKLNWDTSAFCSDVPVTLAFPSHAREVLEILGRQDLVLDDRYMAS